MIEKMIEEIKPYLPLKISEANWELDNTMFGMHGSGWGFATLSDWRLSLKIELFWAVMIQIQKRKLKC